MLRGDATACGTAITSQMRDLCDDVPGPWAGKCSCTDALQASGENPPAASTLSCGNVTSQLRNFCENPTAAAVAVGIEDGRIGQRVK